MKTFLFYENIKNYLKQIVNNKIKIMSIKYKQSNYLAKFLEKSDILWQGCSYGRPKGTLALIPKFQKNVLTILNERDFRYEILNSYY